MRTGDVLEGEAMKRTVIQILALMLLGWALTGCGATKTITGDTSQDLSSRIDLGDEDIEIDGYAAECVAFNESDMNLNGVLTTYYDPTYGYIGDWVRLNLNSVPDEIDSDTNHYLQFFLWGESGSSLVTDETPVRLFFQNIQTGQWLNSDEEVTQISKNVIQSLIAENDLSNMSVDQFISTHMVLLTGVDLEWDALMTIHYDGSTYIDHTNALVPAFFADPNKYAETHFSTALIETHPLYDRRNSGLTDEQFYGVTQGWCL